MTDLWKKRHYFVKKSDKKFQNRKKCDKKSQTSEKKLETSEKYKLVRKWQIYEKNEKN